MGCEPGTVFVDKSIALHPVPLCLGNFKEGQRVATFLALGVAICTRCAWCFGALAIAFQSSGSGATNTVGVLPGGLLSTLRTSLGQSWVIVVCNSVWRSFLCRRAPIFSQNRALQHN